MPTFLENFPYLEPRILENYPNQKFEIPTPERLMKILRENAPTQSQIIGAVVIVTIATAVVMLMTVGGLLMGGLSIGGLVLTCLFILFVPVLVAGFGTVLFIGTTVLVTGTGFTVAVVSALRWLYLYLKGYHPPGSCHVDAAKRSVIDAAYRLKEMAGVYVNNAVQEIDTARRLNEMASVYVNGALHEKIMRVLTRVDQAAASYSC
ncbi:hypothetical protein R1flu_014735 [Riccia fluitans]|uniref:Oleosin n=1 Tax=Riccia fluitans TaxID=41844 RepID=A0ABD1YGX7_9MARC